MFSVLSLLALLVSLITGSPVEVRNSLVTLPMTRRLTFSNVTDILRHDEARMAAFREYSTHGPRADVPLLNFGMGYTVDVNIGSPPATYRLVVESSSSITWVGTDSMYVSLTGVDTGKLVAVDYRYGGSFQGMTYNNHKLKIPTITLHQGMPIAVASAPRDIVGFDGVLGIGPTVSSLGALRNPNSRGDTIPPVTDYLFRQRAILQPVVGIFFRPVVQGAVDYGQLTFGGANPNMYRGRIGYTSVTATPPSSQYWGINQSITYGDVELLPYSAGVVDCGCTFLYIASDAYESYRMATGGIVNAANGLLQITTNDYNNLLPLRFYIGEEIYRFGRNAQIWPRSLNHVVHGNRDDIFLVVRRLDTPIGEGYDFINGYVFLERFYTVFDAGMSRVGFARTRFTFAITN
ncbi:aspartic peptidase A1 [Suillus spraguei]|nr:aspartic peptidase A1 [Suillus spraguei]